MLKLAYYRLLIQYIEYVHIYMYVCMYVCMPVFLWQLLCWFLLMLLHFLFFFLQYILLLLFFFLFKTTKKQKLNDAKRNQFQGFICVFYVYVSLLQFFNTFFFLFLYSLWPCALWSSVIRTFFLKNRRKKNDFYFYYVLLRFFRWWSSKKKKIK